MVSKKHTSHVMLELLELRNLSNAGQPIVGPLKLWVMPNKPKWIK